MDRRNRSAVRDEENGNVENGAFSPGNCHISSLFPDIVFLVRSKPANEDPSAKMWFLFISQADKFDAAVAERWKADMDGILVYVCSNE
jgi:hypothetical protein